MMKIYFVENIISNFMQVWPEYYYLADFILTHIISHPKFYYNFNRPDYFSLCGKSGHKMPFVEFISSVANVPEREGTPTIIGHIEKSYLLAVGELIRGGAPLELFNSDYR